MKKPRNVRLSTHAKWCFSCGFSLLKNTGLWDWDWIVGLVVESTCCFYTGPRFSSQRPCAGSQPSLIPVLGTLMSSLDDFWRHQASMRCTYVHASKTLMHKISKSKPILKNTCFSKVNFTALWLWAFHIHRLDLQDSKVTRDMYGVRNITLRQLPALYLTSLSIYSG